MNNSLYFIGNGFDLHCGLKSSFSDFYKYECQKHLQVDDIDENMIRNIDLKLSNINFYIFLMAILKNCNNDFVATFRLYETRFNDNVINWSDFEQNLFYILTDMNLYTLLNQIYNISSNIYTGLKYSFHVYFNEWKKNNKFKDYITFLYIQLKNFENDFTEYMNNQVNDSKYKDKKDNLIFLFEIDNYSYVLNFNYTRLNGRHEKFTENNIHGTLKNNNIIIGIDDFDIDIDSYHYDGVNIDLFTKTTRIMMDQRIDELKNNLPKDIKEIIFYGHSLNRQDYSYFQSVFDYYNIYNSDIKLKFYYSDNYANLQDEKEKIKMNQLYNIKKLLSEYGKTLDNKDHGKNLMHKLMLENRLFLDKV